MKLAARMRFCSAVLARFALTVVVLSVSGCGNMLIEEVYYLAVPGENNTNYYRIRVEAEARQGVAEYRAGWFPAETVDQLYGGSLEPDSAAAYRTREDLRGMYDEAIKQTMEGYLSAAKDPNASPEVIGNWLKASRRVRSAASDGVALPPGAIEVEYDPAASLTLRHSGEKLVLMLSSDPSKVIEAMKNFTQSEKTGASVLRLADLVKQQAGNRVVEAEAENSTSRKIDLQIASQLDELITLLESGGKSLNRRSLLSEISATLQFVEDVQ